MGAASSGVIRVVRGQSHTFGNGHHSQCASAGVGPIHGGPSHMSEPAAGAPTAGGQGGPLCPGSPQDGPSEIGKDKAGLVLR